MSKHFFIGVDGGATSCRARIRDMDGALLGEGESGPANIHANLPLAIKSIQEAANGALRSAGLAKNSLSAAHAGLGLAGAGLKSACDQLRATPIPFGSIQLETDAYVAWLGAHEGEDGGIALVGQGPRQASRLGAMHIGGHCWTAQPEALGDLPMAQADGPFHP